MYYLAQKEAQNVALILYISTNSAVNRGILHEGGVTVHFPTVELNICNVSNNTLKAHNNTTLHNPPVCTINLNIP